MSDRAYVAWSEAIQLRRKQLNLRQDELADLARVSTRFVHTVESAKPTIQLRSLLRVLHVLGLSLRLTGPGVDVPVRLEVRDYE